MKLNITDKINFNKKEFTFGNDIMYHFNLLHDIKTDMKTGSFKNGNKIENLIRIGINETEYEILKGNLDILLVDNRSTTLIFTPKYEKYINAEKKLKDLKKFKKIMIEKFEKAVYQQIYYDYGIYQEIYKAYDNYIAVRYTLKGINEITQIKEIMIANKEEVNKKK